MKIKRFKWPSSKNYKVVPGSENRSDLIRLLKFAIHHRFKKFGFECLYYFNYKLFYTIYNKQGYNFTLIFKISHQNVSRNKSEFQAPRIYSIIMGIRSNYLGTTNNFRPFTIYLLPIKNEL